MNHTLDCISLTWLNWDWVIFISFFISFNLFSPEIILSLCLTLSSSYEKKKYVSIIKWYNKW